MEALLALLLICQKDYAFCAGRLYKQQADYNAAAYAKSVCTGEMYYEAEMLDLARLPYFGDVIMCQEHLAACGYSVLQWRGASLQKWREAKKLCER